MLKAVDVRIVYFPGMSRVSHYNIVSILTDPPSVDCDGLYENCYKV